jgi:hypothetical protein
MIKWWIHIVLSFFSFLIGYRYSSNRKGKLELTNVPILPLNANGRKDNCIKVYQIETEAPCPAGENITHLDIQYTDDKYDPSNIISELNCDGFPSTTRKMPYIHTHVHEENRGVLDTVFQMLHHPTTPSPKGELFMTTDPVWPEERPVDSCNEIFITRTGQRVSTPNKCVALVSVSKGSNSQYYQTNRFGTSGIGTSGAITDKYMNDYGRKKFSYKIEEELLKPFLKERESLRKEFLKLTGGAFDSNGKRKLVLIMVTNDGHLDLLLNFMCSIKAANIKLDETVVYVGQKETIPIIESMGAHAIFNAALGKMPKDAAKAYADLTFSRFMWLKVTSVYLAATAGFDVLFQDVDLVWMKDPKTLLRSIHEDMSFMDDGARGLNFAPFYANSGFYFMKYNERTVYLQEKMLKSMIEISYSHSHQSTLMKHALEAHHLMGLQVRLLDQEAFPSGEMYHHRKPFIYSMTNYSHFPYLFHMCWTASRIDKVLYISRLIIAYFHISLINI